MDREEKAESSRVLNPQSHAEKLEAYYRQLCEVQHYASLLERDFCEWRELSERTTRLRELAFDPRTRHTCFELGELPKPLMVKAELEKVKHALDSLPYLANEPAEESRTADHAIIDLWVDLQSVSKGDLCKDEFDRAYPFWAGWRNRLRAYFGDYRLTDLECYSRWRDYAVAEYGFTLALENQFEAVLLADAEKYLPDVAQSTATEPTIPKEQNDAPKDGLDRETRSFRWLGELYKDLPDDAMKAIEKIEKNHRNSRPTPKDTLLDNTVTSIGKLFRRGDAKKLFGILEGTERKSRSVDLPKTRKE